MGYAFFNNDALHLPQEIIRRLDLNDDDQLDCAIQDDSLRLTLLCKRSRAGIITKPLFQINCFERFTLLRNGQHVHLRCAKACELIALLLMERKRPISKLKAASLLWLDTLEEHALDSLYKVLREVRIALPDLPLEVYRRELALDTTNIVSDIVQFEELYTEREDVAKCEQAVRLYSGPLLADEDYEWTSILRSYYAVRFSELIDTLVKHERQQHKTHFEHYYHDLADSGL
jgi:two-component SAPR family response regulator